MFKKINKNIGKIIKIGKKIDKKQTTKWIKMNKNSEKVINKMFKSEQKLKRHKMNKNKILNKMDKNEEKNKRKKTKIKRKQFLKR